METTIYDVKTSFQDRLARLRAVMSELSIIVPGVSDESILDKTESFIREIKKIHGDKFDYSKVVYVNRRTYIVLKCPTHGEFIKKPYEMYSAKAGCKFCNRAAMGQRSRMTIETFVERCNKVHDNKFDYSKVVLDQTHSKVTIICPVHGEFSQQAHNHLNGFGCARCNKAPTYSTVGMDWIRFLCVTKNLLHIGNGGEYLIVPTRYRADGYDPETRTVYEFHGSLYHGDPRIYSADYVNPFNKQTMGELYAKTLARRDEIIGHGYNYVEIWESEWVYAVRVVVWIQRMFRRSRGTLSDRKAIQFPKRMAPRFTSAAIIQTQPLAPIVKQAATGQADEPAAEPATELVTRKITKRAPKKSAEPTADQPAEPTNPLVTRKVTKRAPKKGANPPAAQPAEQPAEDPAKPPPAEPATPIKIRVAAPVTEKRISKDLWKLIYDYTITYHGMFNWGFLESAKITPEYFHRDLMEIWKELSPDSRKRITVSDFNEAIMWINEHYLTDIITEDINKTNLAEWIWRCRKTGFWLALEPFHLIKEHVGRRLAARGF